LRRIRNAERSDFICELGSGYLGKVFTGYGNPVEAIGAALGGLMVLVGLVIILLAQLSTNVAANLYAPGYVLSSVFAPRMSFARGVLIGGAIGLIAVMPWRLVNAFLTYLQSLDSEKSPGYDDYRFTLEEALAVTEEIVADTKKGAFPEVLGREPPRLPATPPRQTRENPRESDPGSTPAPAEEGPPRRRRPAR